MKKKSEELESEKIDTEAKMQKDGEGLSSVEKAATSLCFCSLEKKCQNHKAPVF